MAQCELCGQNCESSQLITIKVAGSFVQSCSRCKNLGHSTTNNIDNSISKNIYKKKKDEELYEVVSNYAGLLNSAMQKKQTTIRHIAKALNIKESSLNKFFSGKIKPNLEMSRKLENHLGISLTKEYNSSSKVNADDFITKPKENQDLSLGDMLISELEKSRNNIN